MVLIRENETQREDDMTTDTHYILSLVLDKWHPPLVVPVARDYESVKWFVREYTTAYNEVQWEDVLDTQMQKSVIKGIIIWVLQCIDRAWDTHITDRLKEDEDTKNLFNKNNHDINDVRKNDLASERQYFTNYLEELFGWDKKTGGEDTTDGRNVVEWERATEWEAEQGENYYKSVWEQRKFEISQR